MKKGNRFNITKPIGMLVSPIVLIVMLFAIMMMLTSCDDINNKDQYDTAVIYVGGEWINVEIDSWSYEANCGRIELTDKDGKTYHVDSMNVTLIDTDNN